MTDCNTWLQTAAQIGSSVAAISSAIAAFVALWVAKNTFTFQKNSLLKKASIEQMLKLLQQLYYLKSLTDQAVLSVTDDEYTELKHRISDTRNNVKTLESMISGTRTADLETIRDFVHGLREDSVFALNNDTPNVALRYQLDGAIDALQKIYSTEIK